MGRTAIQELIDEIVEHLTYDDDLSDDSRITLETIRLRCLSKLKIEDFNKDEETLYTEEEVRKAYWIGVNKGNGVNVMTDDEYIQSIKQK
jgi:hypothetical protein